MAQAIPGLPVGAFVQAGTVRRLSAAELVACTSEIGSGCLLPMQSTYDAPLVDEASRVAARSLPALMTATPDDPAAAVNR